MESRLPSFLVEAKRSTYAAGSAARVECALPGGIQLEYRSGDWFYRDIYFGEDFLAGQELVYYRNRPWWTMVYSGGIKLEQPPAEKIYAFLQSALLQVTTDAPFRGPELFVEGDYRYACASRGSVEWVEGMEVIFHRERIAYQLTFSGGMIN
ncbi:MAG: DUF5680 domain-containing protein [Bellilinea sp.]|jgi:hypothetical protein